MGLIAKALLAGTGIYAINKLTKANEQQHNNSPQAPYSRGQQDGYPSREPLEYGRQGNYGPPPYHDQAPQQSREQRYNEKGESQGYMLPESEEHQGQGSSPSPGSSLKKIASEMFGKGR